MTRTRESGYSLSLSKQRAICSQPRLLFLVAKVIRQGATLPLQAEWHTSLLVKKKLKIKGKLQKKSEGKGFLKVNEQFFQYLSSLVMYYLWVHIACWLFLAQEVVHFQQQFCINRLKTKRSEFKKVLTDACLIARYCWLCSNHFTSRSNKQVICPHNVNLTSRRLVMRRKKMSIMGSCSTNLPNADSIRTACRSLGRS